LQSLLHLLIPPPPLLAHQLLSDDSYLSLFIWMIRFSVGMNAALLWSSPLS
jgi:hypothetical protein